MRDLTGFGQAGAYKDMAGHDINYLATSGFVYSFFHALGSIAVVILWFFCSMLPFLQSHDL